MVKISLPRRRARPDVPGLPAGERALAWADVGVEDPRTGDAAPTGAHWVGTSTALYIPPGDVPDLDGVPSVVGDWSRVRWTEVEQADWDEATQRMNVRELAPFGEVGAVHVARLLGAERLLQLVRERVMAVLVRSQTVPSSSGGSFRVAARRSPESPRELLWSVELPAGADPGDPRVAREAAAALATVRAELGVEG